MTSLLPSTDRLEAGVRALRARLAGELVTPGDIEWDSARTAWNLAADQRPAMVAVPESTDDIVEIVRYAAYRGLRVAPQGTGHNAVPLGDLADAVLVKTHRMRGVEVDPVARVARVEAGALWMDVVGPAGEHGLAALSGSSPDVGVVGYTLGGGLSWLVRKHGASAHNVVAAEIVTADGELRRVDRDNDPELFWALRGGGGSFGVVTALEIKLFPIESVYAGMLIFPQERASEVLHAWRELVPSLPEEMTSVGRILNVPPLEEIPEPVRGRSLVVVEAIYIGDEAEGAELIAPLRALGPEMDTFATIPPSALIHLHMDPDHPVPGKGDHMLFEALSAETIDAILSAAGPGTQSPLLSIEVRHLGGALKRSAPHHGALDTIDPEFVMFGVGMTMDAEMHAAVSAGLERLMAAVAPYDSGREYLNFAEKKTDVRRFYSDANYERLCRVKAEYDPQDVFRSNHPLPAAQ